jgi:HlyD family secretion protein
VANIVNYVVEVDAQNQEGLFLPGMTAEVDFIIAEKTNVLIAPKTALNFQPDSDTLKRFTGRLHASAVARLDSAGKTEDRDDKTGYLWYLNDQGELAVEQVQTGVTDNTHTELVNPGRLREGMKVISGVLESDSAKQSSKSTSKKVIGMPNGGGGPPPPGG